MGDKNIKKNEKKKKKKTDEVSFSPITYERPVMTQPELIKKKKKIN